MKASAEFCTCGRRREDCERGSEPLERCDCCGWLDHETNGSRGTVDGAPTFLCTDCEEDNTPFRPEAIR